MPLATLILGVGSFTGLVFADALEPMQQAYIGMGIMLATPLLLAIWLLFLSGLRWTQRFLYLILGSIAMVGLAFGFGQIVRWEGSLGGSGIPKLRWIWLPPEGAALADLRVEAKKKIELSSIEETDYPQFLGRNRDGVVQGVRLVRDWKSHPPKELWRKSIGLGWSAFAVVGEYAITQERREDKELVVCYEVKTGKVSWKHERDIQFHDRQGSDGPRATPTVVDGKVHTMGASGMLDCIDCRCKRR